MFLMFILTTSQSHGLKITTPLIHSGSVLSLTEISTEERANRVSEASNRRHAYISSVLNGDNVKPQAGVAPGFYNNIFFVNFSVGDPPVTQFGIMDTGSTFLWIKCLPCTPCSSSSEIPIFDPAKSKTNSALRCRRDCEKCTIGWLPWFPVSHCMYSTKYIDGSISEGIYVTDRLTFRTSASDEKSNVTLPKVEFGCSSLSTGGGQDMDRRFNGILGLGISTNRDDILLRPGYVPLVKQLGSKFSYCTGRISDRSYAYNQLSFGDSANLLGVSTPIYTDTGYYFVRLLNISIGGLVIYLYLHIYSNKGMLVDSGSELMSLPSKAMDTIIDRVKKLAGDLELTQGSSFWELCYKGSLEKEGAEFPPLGLHFEGGAKMWIDNHGMFFQFEDVFCLAIQRSEKVSILGMVAQQSFNVGFDLMQRRLYFQNLDCGVLQGS
ncbi:Aspartyl protease UND [Linum grandiflorum]